eukprot:7776497-Pyramimonas_sp.AAC.1
MLVGEHAGSTSTSDQRGKPKGRFAPAILKNSVLGKNLNEQGPKSTPGGLQEAPGEPQKPP